MQDILFTYKATTINRSKIFCTNRIYCSGFSLTMEMAGFEIEIFIWTAISTRPVMTGLEGNRQIYLPREIQDRLPKSFY